MSSYLDLDQEKGYSKLIEKLVEAKSEPIKQLEKNKSKEKLKTEVIDDLSKELIALKNYADQLFGINSSFRKKKFSSTDSFLLDGSVSQNAQEGEFKVQINNLAKKHRLASKSIKVDDFISAGTFSLKVGNKTDVFRFKGGSIRDLEKLINKSKKKIVSFTLIKQSENETIAILTSTKEGAKNEIKLISDPEGVLMNLNFYKKNQSQNQELISNNFEPQGDNNLWEQGILKISPLSGEEIPLNQISFSKGDVISLTVSWRNLKGQEELLSEKIVNREMEIEEKDRIVFEQLSFKSERIISFTLDGKERIKATPVRVEQVDPFFLTALGVADKPIKKKYYLPKDFFNKDFGEANINFSAESFLGGKKNCVLTALILTNNNTFFEFDINAPTLIEKNTGKDFVPANEITPAENSKITYQGIQVERDNNQITDLIDGVELNLKATSQRDVAFAVGKDSELVFNNLINFIGQFNICMGKINLLLSRDPAPEDAEEIDKKKHGLFRDDLSLKLMRDKFKNITVRPHATSTPSELALLSQLGITSVFILGGANDPDSRKLDFQEENYRNIYNSKSDLVAELFGYDQDGDFIIDSGVAFEISRLAKNYIGANSIFASKKNISERRIKDMDKDIEKKERQVESYRAKQVEDFGKLDAAERQMEKMQGLLKNSLDK